MSSTNFNLPDSFVLDDEIARLTSVFSGMWQRVADTPMPFGCVYTPEQKRQNEVRLDEFMPEADQKPKSRKDAERRIVRMKDLIRDLVLKTVDDGRRDQIDRMLTAFSDGGDEFVRRSREFDENLHSAGIFQALRNVWIINSMQEAFGLPVSVNPSGFAYSLLYTYTDSYLDATEIAEAQKEVFGGLFAQRLSGFKIPEDSLLLSKVSDLVRIIEAEYPRHRFPGVYASLLAIHGAQQKSLQQRPDKGVPCEPDILRLSVEKGGTSVIADAYVAKGDPTITEISFAFGYGVFLQFIDDLQDVKEDVEGGSETLFTRAAHEGTLDGITNRLVRYLRQVLIDVTPLHGLRGEALTELILQGSLGLILESVALNPERYSEDYVRTAEACSPLGFDAIRRLYIKRALFEMDADAQSRGLNSSDRRQIYRDLQETLPRWTWAAVTK